MVGIETGGAGGSGSQPVPTKPTATADRTMIDMAGSRRLPRRIIRNLLLRAA
jgi:hypothetical protein